MSFSKSTEPMYYYLCDGVSWNWDAEEYTEEEYTEEEYLEGTSTTKNETAIAEEVVFSKNFNSSEAYRSHHFFDVLNSNLHYIGNRYCQYERLSKDYAEVAMQRNVLKDIVFVHTADLEINFTINHIKSLNEVIQDIYNNTARNSVYNRVGRLQRFLHECTTDNGKKIEYLDREVMRKLLSLSRLHIAISDIRKNNIDLIKDELLQNHFDSKKNLLTTYTTIMNRQYTQNWKKRHLRSLLHFCPQVERNILKGLLNLNPPFNKNEVQEVIFKRNK